MVSDYYFKAQSTVDRLQFYYLSLYHYHIQYCRAVRTSNSLRYMLFPRSTTVLFIYYALYSFKKYVRLSRIKTKLLSVIY